MSHVLVTGGAGYVGSVCCHQLIESGHTVTVLDNLSTGHAEAVPPSAVLCRLDYGDRAGIDRLLREERFDAVFHFAAKALIAESVSNPGIFFQENVASCISFLEALRTAGIKRFVFSSSAAVYGSPECVPIAEDHPTNPVNSYGETKLMLERILRWYARAYQWTVVAFRYFNAAGATNYAGEDHRPETHIIPLLLEAAGGSACFGIYGDDYETRDGTCIRDFVHVSDIAAAHILALNVPASAGMDLYNIGSGHSYSVREVIRVVETVTGLTVPVRISGRRAGDPAILCASPAKLMNQLGWRPAESNLHEIVASAWKWHRRRRSALAA